MSSTTIQDLMRKEDYREDRASHLFKSRSQFEWFIRTNKDRLTANGAYIPGAGRRQSLVDAPRMDQEIVSICGVAREVVAEQLDLFDETTA